MTKTHPIDTKVRFSNTQLDGDVTAYNSNNGNVRLRYQVNPALQLFGNASRSTDPAVTWYHGSTGVDYANTLEAPGYVVPGLKLGYEAPGKRWSAFLDARNLGNRHYVTASTTAYDLMGVDTANFRPGDGFGVTVGATLRF